MCDTANSKATPPAAGVVCEFNPFHNGHVRLLSAMRQAVGPHGCVICIMSGRFVQRGVPAFADPYLRARMALSGGADLVMELPFPWSASGAETFAAAGVSLLSRLGVDILAFGSETGQLSLLDQAAHAAVDPSFSDQYAALIRQGRGTAEAYTQAIRAGIHDPPNGFPCPNDLLAISYLKALLTERSVMTPLIVRREGQSYCDDTLKTPAAPSASALRALLREVAVDPVCLAAVLKDTMPDQALRLLLEAVRIGAAPAGEDILLPFYHVFFRLGDPALLEHTAELGGGLAGRMVDAAKKAGTPQEFWNALHSRLYPDTRLRRGMLFAATGVGPQDIRTAPVYTALLAANAAGRQFLRIYEKKMSTRSGCRDSRTVDHTDGEISPLAVITKPANALACRQRILCQRADSLFTLCLPRPAEAGALLRKTPFIV